MPAPSQVRFSLQLLTATGCVRNRPQLIPFAHIRHFHGSGKGSAWNLQECSQILLCLPEPPPQLVLGRSMLLWSRWKRETQTFSTWLNPSQSWQEVERFVLKQAGGVLCRDSFLFCCAQRCLCERGSGCGGSCGCQTMPEWDFSMGAASPVCGKSTGAPKGLFGSDSARFSV